jgi:CheY-specific phosphatase CheX
MADAIGEIANVAAGVLKSSRAKAGQAVQLGLPLFLEGSSCIEFFASGIQGMAQTVRGPNNLEAHVIIIWQEG